MLKINLNIHLKQASCMLACAFMLNGSMIMLAQESSQPNTEDVPDKEAVTLENVVVEGVRTDDVVLIEQEVSTSSKLDAPIMELPRSVSIISREQIEQRGAQSIQDTLTYSSGVLAGPYGFDSRLDSARVRGISPLKYTDGFQSLFQFYNNTRSDIYTLDSIEVIKGPSSVLYGQGALGGIINSSSKLPMAETMREIQLQYGSFDRKQIAADFTGAIDKEGKLLYRTVGLIRDSNTQVDYVEDNAQIFMPSLTWKPTGQTSLTALVNIQDNEGGQSLQFLPTEGTLLPGEHIPTSRFIGEPGWDRYDTQQQAYSLFLDHAFNETFSLDVNGRYNDGSADYKSHWVTYDGSNPTIADDGTVKRTIYDAPATSKSYTANAILTAEYETNPIDHKTLIGIDFIEAKTDTDSGMAANWDPDVVDPTLDNRINIYNPVYGNLNPPTVIDAPADTLTQIGLFLRDQMKYNHWILSGGLRYDTVENKQNGGGLGSSITTINEDAFTGDVGLMYQFDFGLSPYGSWSQSFQPQGKALSNGSEIQLDPKRGEQFELGVKYQPPGTQALFTASVFDITEEERPLANGRMVTQDSVTTQGIELESQYNWRDFYLQAGYSYVDAKNSAGASIETVPDHMAFAWVTWKPSKGPLEGFRAGAGVRHVGKRWDGADTLSADPYTLADAMIGYEYNSFDLQLNVANLADHEFVAATQGGRSFYGERLRIMLTGTYRF